VGAAFFPLSKRCGSKACRRLPPDDGATTHREFSEGVRHNHKCGPRRHPESPPSSAPRVSGLLTA